MLPALVEQPPEGAEWLHEIKYDGYRTQFVISDGEIRAFTRNGYDWSDRYAPIVDAAYALDCRAAIIDGEMCAQDAAGITDFSALRSAIYTAPHLLVFFAFDLLHLDGQDLRRESLIDRRRRLENLIGPADPAFRIHFSPHHVGDGAQMFAAADRAGLEGIVSKRAASRYVSGRTDAWRKTKCFTVDDFEVLGVDRSSTGIPIALLGSVDGAYAGDAMIALKAGDREEFWAAVERMGAPKARLAWMAKRKGAKWINSGLQARVRHLRGGDKLLRHATLQGLSLRNDPPSR